MSRPIPRWVHRGWPDGGCTMALYTGEGVGRTPLMLLWPRDCAMAVEYVDPDACEGSDDA